MFLSQISKYICLKLRNVCLKLPIGSLAADQEGFDQIHLHRLYITTKMYLSQITKSQIAKGISLKMQIGSLADQEGFD